MPRASAQEPAAAPQDPLRVFLVTMGPGEEVWNRFGHNAIWIHDDRTGEDLVWNWGIFSFSQVGFVPRLIRGEMIQELSEDYVRVARAKGLSEAAVTVKHALRNALIPVVTVMGMQFGGLIAFSLVTETIFQIPGMGKLLIDSIGLNDQPVVMAYLLLVAVIFVTINLVVDLLYTVIDPRVRVQA